jgi:predicted Zn-dependent protease
MKDRSPFFAACCFVATALSLSLAGCNSSESRAREAFSDYQAASAAGDLVAARIALLQLVAAKDDQPDYWQELGKVQIQLGAYSDAYYAFTRAYELDKSNPEVLSTLTQLALLSGNIDVAEEHARKLELLAPDHPAIKLTMGYVAMKRSNLDEADRQVDALLQAFPYEPSAKLLKGRILLARGLHDDAVRLLEDQVRVKPDDAGSWKALIALHERDSDWKGVAEAASRLASLNEKDTKSMLTAIDAYFRYGNVTAGLEKSEELLGPKSPPDQVEAVLNIWAERWKSQQALQEARRLSRNAAPQQSLAYATYFNSAGSPDDAAAMLGGGEPRLPVSLTNLSSNAVIAESLALRGGEAQAKHLFDAILAKEPDHVYALRGRINLEIRTGAPKAAIVDAQRLVSIVPRSARDRLLLARAFEAAGDRRQVDRTLWDAFHEIPANVVLYEALRDHVQKAGGPEAAAQVTAEFQQQQDTDLSREFI